MRINLSVFLAFSAIHAPVWAAEENDPVESEKNWSIGISTGVTAIQAGNDQLFGSLSIDRDLGDGYVGLAVTHVDSGDVAGLINAVQASSTEFTLSGGTSLNAVSLDGYISYGKRNFDTETIRRADQSAQISSDGDLFGIGGTISYDIALNNRLFLTPSASIDYNEIDIARIAQGAGGQTVALASEESGVTGSGGLALQQIFGSGSNHLASLIGNVVTTSNTSSFNPGNSQSAVVRALAARDQAGQSDSWAELGLALSFGLNDHLRLDLSGIQTLGFVNGDATSLAVGLRYSF